MIKKILQHTNKKLRNKSIPLQNNHNIKKLKQNMLDTLQEHGGVGLAAPQIGTFYRLILIAEPNRRPFFLINPKIIQHSNQKQSFQEGCLSVKNITASIERPEQITIEYHDENFNIKQAVSYGFEATIIQHEINHLDGIIFTDLI